MFDYLPLVPYGIYLVSTQSRLFIITVHAHKCNQYHMQQLIDRIEVRT